jgi:hypothetical protein
MCMTSHPTLVILLCLVPDDFTYQGENSGTDRVNQTLPMCLVNPLSYFAPYFIVYSV